jgi:hypothetical protein
MSAFNEGLMTGASLGRGVYGAQQNRRVGGMLSSGDYTGAAQTAYATGDLQGGQAITTLGRAEDARTRSQNITGALKTGDYTGAMNFASSPEELAAITEYRDSASEAERADAAQRATSLASVIQSIQSLPPEQQLDAARRVAPQFGVDPNTITPESLQQLDALRLQALGLKDFLEFQQDERAAQRPIIGNGFISLPPGSQVPGQPQSLGAQLPPGWVPENPNQPASGQPVRAFNTESEAEAAIRRFAPNARVTSRRRSPGHNRRVGGAPNSYHVHGRALDLVPGPGQSMADLYASLQGSGIRFRELLNEGDHVHVAW